MATATYAIDIAANMPNGDKTIGDLDEITKQLLAGGKGADFFNQAITQVANQLTVADAAATLANASLAEGQRTFDQLEKAAVKAAVAEEKAALAGRLDPSVARSAFEARAALEAYSSELKNLEANADAANAEEKKLAQTHANLKQLSGHVDKSLAGQAESTEKLRGALSSVPGPVGKLGSSLLGPIQGFQKLSAEMGASNAAMLLGITAAAAVAIAIVAVGVAALAAAAKVAAWAIGLADAGRNAALSQEAVNALHPEIAALSGSYAALTDETGQTSAKLNDLAKQLLAAKVSAEDMPAALRAAANAETALAGNGGASKFLEDIKAGKVAVGELAAETQAKFGGIVAKQMMGLDAQSERLKKNVGEIFGSLDIDSVLGAVRTLVDLFDKSSATGQAMKMIFESVFQPMINQAQNAAYVIEAFAIGFLIGLTKIYIAVKPAIKAVSEFLGFKDTSLTDTLDIAKVAGELIAPVFVGIVGLFGLLAVAVGIAIAPFVALSVAAYALVGAVVAVGVAVLGSFMSAWQSVKEFFAGLDLSQVGSDIMTGLANGITGAAGAVVGAITGAVGGAIDAAKNLLGIASPSKVFAEIGDNTGAGLVQGVEGATADVQDAFASMVEPPDVPASALEAQDTPWGASVSPGAAAGDAPAAGDSSAAPASGGKAVPAHVEVNLYGVAGAADAIVQIKEALTEILRGDAVAAAGAKAAPA